MPNDLWHIPIDVVREMLRPQHRRFPIAPDSDVNGWIVRSVKDHTRVGSTVPVDVDDEERLCAMIPHAHDVIIEVPYVARIAEADELRSLPKLLDSRWYSDAVSRLEGLGSARALKCS